MFYIIFIAAIVFALYLIFHDNREGEGTGRKTVSRSKMTYRPENSGPVPLTPVSPTPKPLEPAPRVAKAVSARPAAPTVDPLAVPQRELSWSYLYTLEYDDGIVADVLETEIAGMRYYCGLADLGPVNGVVKPEPDNPHDPRAQVVIRADGKKLGYLPRTSLNVYGEFNPDKRVCPFAGRVKVTRQGYIWAEILVALPLSRDFVKDQLSAYLEANDA